MSETLSDSQDFSANAPGIILKRCREFHHISLSEAAEATKIGENYLIALENDSIREFASIAYLKGFLRIYSSYLGLNADDMIRLYERLYEPITNQKKKTKGLVGGDGTKRRNWFSWQKLAMPSILLFLLIITATFFNKSPMPTQQHQTYAPASLQAPAIQPTLSTAGKTINSQKPLESIPSQTTEKKEEAAVVPKETAKAAIETPKFFFVRMKVLQNNKLAVAIDGAAPQGYDLNSGDIIEWKASKNIAFELSNGGGVEAELNGKPLKPFGPTGKPAYIVIDADGIKK